MRIIKGLIKLTFIVFIILAVIAFVLYEYKDALIPDAKKEIQQIQIIEENKKDADLEKALKTKMKVEKALEGFNLRFVIATGSVEFPFTPIDKSDFMGQNTEQYRYKFDYDIGTEADNLDVFYDPISKVPVIVIPKEKIKEYRVREVKHELVERERTMANKLVKRNIDDTSFSSNQAAAKIYAEQLVKNDKEAWYSGEYNEDNQFQQAYEKLEENLTKFLKAKGLGPNQYKIKV